MPALFVTQALGGARRRHSAVEVLPKPRLRPGLDARHLLEPGPLGRWPILALDLSLGLGRLSQRA